MLGRIRTRVLVASGAAVAMLILPATSADALVQKTGGSKSCAVDQRVGIAAEGQGNINYYVNGAWRFGRYHGLIYSYTYRYTNRSISSWRVTSDDILVNAGTLAVCLN
jgi:hypothetical protein